LHDDLGQQLTALKMGIAALEPRLAGGGNDPAGLAATHDLQSQADSMIASLRRIAANLRPPMLDDLGLTAALEWLVDDFKHRYQVSTTLRVDFDDADITTFAANALYRIAQEALTNVARHAHASNVVIAISRDANTCTMHIEDDGRGTVMEDAGKHGSLGLLGMRERVRQLHGTLTIDSAPGKGFRITARLPLSAIRPDGKPPR
jgi:signal transduction histidine kinase